MLERLKKTISVSIIDYNMISESKYFYVRLEDSLDLGILNENKEAITKITKSI